MIRNRTVVLGLSLIVVLLPLVPTRAAGDDGVFWNQMTETQKATFVDGFTSGVAYGYRLFDTALSFASAEFDPKLARFAADAEKGAHRQINHDFGGRTVGQFVAGLNEIYSDYRNTSIPVSEAIIVVLRGLDGTPATEVEQLLERKRKEASGGKNR
jgi:hypothetical protein